MKKTFLILGAVILLAVSIFLDLIFKRFQNLNNRMEPVIPFGVEMAVYIILTILLLFLAWLVLYKQPRSALIISVFIILGATVMFSMTFPGFRLMTSTLNQIVTKIYKARPIYEFLSDVMTSRYGFTRISAAVVMAIGLLRLLSDKKLWPEKLNSQE